MAKNYFFNFLKVGMGRKSRYQRRFEESECHHYHYFPVILGRGESAGEKLPTKAKIVSEKFAHIIKNM